MKNTYKFDPYDVIFCSLGVEPIYEGELYGLSHEEAKKVYERMLKEGFYDDESDY